MRSGKQFGCPAHRRPLPPLYESSKNLPSREPCALGANGFFLTEFYHTRIRLTSSLIKFCRWEGDFAVRSPSGGYAQSRLVQQHKKLARTIPKQRPQARSTFNNENQETWECSAKVSKGRPQTSFVFMPFGRVRRREALCNQKNQVTSKEKITKKAQRKPPAFALLRKQTASTVKSGECNYSRISRRSALT